MGGRHLLNVGVIVCSLIQSPVPLLPALHHAACLHLPGASSSNIIIYAMAVGQGAGRALGVTHRLRPHQSCTDSEGLGGRHSSVNMSWNFLKASAVSSSVCFPTRIHASTAIVPGSRQVVLPPHWPARQSMDSSRWQGLELGSYQTWEKQSSLHPAGAGVENKAAMPGSGCPLTPPKCRLPPQRGAGDPAYVHAGSLLSAEHDATCNQSNAGS